MSKNKAGWINVFMLFTSNTGPSIQILQQKLRFTTLGIFFPANNLSNYGESVSQFPVVS